MSEERRVDDGPETHGGPSAASYLDHWRAARWGRKPLILLGAVAGLVLGALYYAMAHPVYEAKVQLLVIGKRPAVGPRFTPLTLAPGENYLATEAGILRSPLVVGRAIDEHSLASLPGLGGGGDLANEIASQLKANRDPKDPQNGVLEVSYRCGDEQSAAAVLSGVIDCYHKFLDEKYQNVSKEAVKLVTSARDEFAKDLDAKEKAYRKYRHDTPVRLLRGQNGSSFNGDQLLLIHSRQIDHLIRRGEIEDRLREIDRALKEGRSREELTVMVSQAMIKSGDGVSLDATGRLVNDTLQEKLLPALLEEKMLLQDYGPNQPGVLAAREKVELARRFVLEILKQELNATKSSEALLAKSFEDHAQDARKSVDFDLEDYAQRAEIVRLQQLYDVTVKRLQDVDLAKDLGGYDAQAISPPVTAKVAPRAIIVFPAALLLGLLFGCGGAYLAAVSDKTFRSAEEVRRRLALPVVGQIPRIRLRQESPETVAASGSELDPTLVAYHRPKSRDAEAYRGVRTALYFSTRGSGRRVIQVTSPSAGDGKSTLAANLAVSIAQSGKRVLLIDADLRKPRVHRIFNFKERTGLSAVMTGECAPAEAVHDSGVPGLSVMPCGPVPANPAELLTSPRFQEVLAILGSQYDFVLLDTPPLLVVTDPSVVAPRVDGVVLTLRITKNGRPQAERAKDILQTLGAPIFGVVINGVAPGGDCGYGYYGPDHGNGGRGDSYYEDGAGGNQTQRSGPAGASAGGAGTRNGAARQPGAGDGKS